MTCGFQVAVVDLQVEMFQLGWASDNFFEKTSLRQSIYFLVFSFLKAGILGDHVGRAVALVMNPGLIEDVVSVVDAARHVFFGDSDLEEAVG